jgi:hypothetical protein
MATPGSPRRGHDRMYIESRIREEVARSKRYAHPFSIATFEIVPAADGVPIRQHIDYAVAAIEATVRPSDVVAHAFDDVVVLLLIETDAAGARDCLMRVRNRLINHGHWNVTLYDYPADADRIEAMTMLSVA